MNTRTNTRVETILADRFLGELCARIQYQKKQAEHYILLAKSSVPSLAEKQKAKAAKIISSIQNLKSSLSGYCKEKEYSLEVVRKELL